MSSLNLFKPVLPAPRELEVYKSLKPDIVISEDNLTTVRAAKLEISSKLYKPAELIASNCTASLTFDDRSLMPRNN
ncbi:MAG: hypothetical protein AB2L11_06795 [Syntrophobacteraceae bacterium]